MGSIPIGTEKVYAQRSENKQLFSLHYLSWQSTRLISGLSRVRAPHGALKSISSKKRKQTIVFAPLAHLVEHWSYVITKSSQKVAKGSGFDTRMEQ